MAETSPLILFGRPAPWRGIWGSVIMGFTLSIGFGLISLGSPHPELAPMLLLFLLIPAITIPLLIAFNRYAVVDRRTWLVSINGGPPRPLSHLTHCRIRTFRGVNTIELGYTDLPRDPHNRLIAPFGSPYERHATLEQAQHFAHEYLK